MAIISLKDRLDVLKSSLLSVPQASLVDILIARSIYDDSLRIFLEAMAKAEQPDASAEELSEMAKSMLVETFGNEDIDLQDAFYYVAELHAVHDVVERIFDKGYYQLVIDLLDFSIQFEENLSGVTWPDDFLDTAYVPLAILALKSHLRLGKTPDEVAELFRKMAKIDAYGLFSDLPDLWLKNEAELAPVKAILDEKR